MIILVSHAFRYLYIFSSINNYDLYINQLTTETKLMLGSEVLSIYTDTFQTDNFFDFVISEENKRCIVS